MFLFPAETLLEELNRFEPKIVTHVSEALDSQQSDLDFIRIDETAFSRCPSLPIDIAVMERTDKGIVVPVDMDWNDVGSWGALWDIGEKDTDNNVCQGDVIARDSEGSFLRTDKYLLTTIGIKDLVVVATDDAILVADKGKVQNVKEIVADLTDDGRRETQSHKTVYRPWGCFRSIDEGPRFQVKTNCPSKPGGILSLQMHHHRAEHWIVVEGTAKVVRGDEEFLLNENQSTYIPLGVKHRLENPGTVPLKLIEVQSGSYLGEDDIVRFEDVYGRGGGKDGTGKG